MSSSIFDIYTIGIGPSSSHTMGPMRAASLFAQKVIQLAPDAVASIRVELFGSLGLTGKGHGTDKAIILGLQSRNIKQLGTREIAQYVNAARKDRQLPIGGAWLVSFDESRDLIFHRDRVMPLHPNGMRFSAFGISGKESLVCEYYSIGGGVVVSGEASKTDLKDDIDSPFPFSSAADILRHCRRQRTSISQLVLENEKVTRCETAIRDQLMDIWNVMQDCVQNGCRREGILPGGLNVQRRAPLLYQTLLRSPERTLSDPLSVLDWVSLYALAVCEENAAGERIVTAPTNGAAGIVPAVLHYYTRFCPSATDDGVLRFLMTAGAMGLLFRQNASISGAEVGCQGEVGVACSMAAAALTETLGGTVEQVENAAEIAMEHNLGLTCDPVMGLVQIPCIERNAMGAIKALSASRIAMRGDGLHRISLDAVIATMRRTGADMSQKYKETSLGGLAVSVADC
ncbi:MAG: L-serine ammonia-lyase [Pirellulales bacterium]|nr:L-serine ammonia-lyase [Pirellulales bacterium]